MTINILGVEYTVKLSKLPKSDYGDCDTDKKVIRINRSKESKAETLIHEVMHAALFESGIVNIIHHTEGLEEAIVRAIEHGLRSAELIPEFNPEEKTEEGETHEIN